MESKDLKINFGKNLHQVRNITGKLKVRMAFFRRNISEVESQTEDLLGPYGNFWESSIEISNVFLDKYGLYLEKHIELERSLTGLLDDVTARTKKRNILSSVKVLKRELASCIRTGKQILGQIDHEILKLKKFNRSIREVEKK